MHKVVYTFTTKDKVLWNLRSIDARNCILKDDQCFPGEENKTFLVKEKSTL